MKRYMIVFLSCIFILSGTNIFSIESFSSEDYITTYSFHSENCPPVEDLQFPKNLSNISNFFTKNLGQVGNDQVRFNIQSRDIWFLDDGIIFYLREPVEDIVDRSIIEYMLEENTQEVKSQRGIALKLHFEGCNKIIPKGRNLCSHLSNFFYGNDSTKWRTKVPNYNEIIYLNLYNNIDLRYYHSKNGLKYEFIVHPKGNPDEIKLKYESADELNLKSPNVLRVQTKIGDIEDSGLLIFQETEDNKSIIKGEFNIIAPLIYNFKLHEDYDRNIDLVIDPFIFSTFIGGNGFEHGIQVETDSNNNIYVAGKTISSNFPTTLGTYDTSYNGGDDCFFLKLNQNGSSLLYSTFIGGSNDDWPTQMILDPLGNVFATGYVHSSDFPITSGAFDPSYNGNYDVYVLKLNSNGSTLLYSTFIGGTNSDHGRGIALDSIGNIFVCGGTESSGFPTTSGVFDTSYNGNSDAFILKLNPSGSMLIYSTFIGGSIYDYGNEIVIDSAGNIIIGGITYSSNFPVTSGVFDTSYNGFYDVYILKLNPTLSTLLYSTFIGGDLNDMCSRMVIDSGNNIFITGHTGSSNFPITPNSYDTVLNGSEDSFVFRLNPTGTSLLYSTFLGGSGIDLGGGLAVDSNGNAYVTCMTSSIDFPTTINTYDNTYNGGPFDISVSKLDSTGSSLLNSTYIGGNDWEVCSDLALDLAGNIYVVGNTSSTNFPTTAGAYDTVHNGGGDVFVFKMNMTPNLSPSVLDLIVSNQSVLRTNSVYLYSNGSDFEDNEQDLTPTFEYRSPTDMNWKADFLSTTVYNNDRWETAFTPLKNATLGGYDFRVRFTDTSLWPSNWFYLYGQLNVLNNIPVCLDLQLSESIASRSDLVCISAQGYDVEDLEGDLAIQVEYQDPNEESWNTDYLDSPMYMNNEWNCDFEIPSDALLGYYDFRIRFNDSDNGSSGWFYLNDSLLVTNLPPGISDIQISRDWIYRTETIHFYVNATDHETPEPLLQIDSQYTPNSKDDWFDLDGSFVGERWDFHFTPKKNATLGGYDFRIRVQDSDGTVCPYIYLNSSFGVLNNHPKVLDPSGIPSEMSRFETIVLKINAEDIEDTEALLEPQFEYKLPSKTSWKDDYLGTPYFDKDTWNYDLTLPADAPTGQYSFRARVMDKDNNWSDYITHEDIMWVNNSKPEIIDFTQEPSCVFRTESFMIKASGTDLETTLEDLICVIEYQKPGLTSWIDLTSSYSKSGDYWYCEFFTTTTSILGKYSFRVEFIDTDSGHSSYSYSMESVLVKNNIPVISADLDDIQVVNSSINLDLTSYGSDIEDPPEKLIWSIDGASVDSSMLSVIISGSQMKITPAEGVEGRDDITVRLMDLDSNISQNEGVTILINNPLDEKEGVKNETTDGDVEPVGNGNETIEEEDNESKDDINGSKSPESSNRKMIIVLILGIALAIMICFFNFQRRRGKHEDKQGSFPNKEKRNIQSIETQSSKTQQDLQSFLITTSPNVTVTNREMKLEMERKEKKNKVSIQSGPVFPITAPVVKTNKPTSTSSLSPPVLVMNPPHLPDKTNGIYAPGTKSQ